MKQAYLILCIFFLASMSGCLDGGENNQEFNFEVTTNLQNDTIIETYVDGERESIQECHFHLNFHQVPTHLEFPLMASIILIPRLPLMQRWTLPSTSQFLIMDCIVSLHLQSIIKDIE